MKLFTFSFVPNSKLDCNLRFISSCQRKIGQIFLTGPSLFLCYSFEQDRASRQIATTGEKRLGYLCLA